MIVCMAISHQNHACCNLKCFQRKFTVMETQELRSEETDFAVMKLLSVVLLLYRVSCLCFISKEIKWKSFFLNTRFNEKYNGHLIKNDVPFILHTVPQKHTGKK